MNERRPGMDIELIDHEVALEIGELCRVCGISRDRIIEWVEEGVVEPQDRQWRRIPASQMRRIRVALRLQHDFELETPALPLVLDLLDEVEALRRQLRVLRRMAH